VVTSLYVNKEPVIAKKTGIYSEIRTSNSTCSTLKLVTSPTVKTGKNYVILSDITYGDDKALINEVWKFRLSENDIIFDINV
jgi:hypothetical protein